LVAAQHVVESRSLVHLMVALGEAGRVVGCVGREAGSEFEISVLLMEMGGDRIAPRDVLVDLSECRQSCGSALRFADGNGTVEPDDLSVGELEQLVVPLHDLDPVGLLDTRRVGMERGDRRLRLYSPSRSRASAACAMSMPSAIGPVSHSLRS